MLALWKGENASIWQSGSRVKTHFFPEDGSRSSRHEYIQLVWLRERGYYKEENIEYKHTYIPSRVTRGESCFCGFELAPQQQ